MKKWFIVGIGVLLLLCLAIVLHLRNNAEGTDDAPVATPVRTTSVDGLPAVTLDNEERQKSGLRTAPLESGSHGRTIPATAVVVAMTELSKLRADSATAQAQAQAAQAKAAASAAQAHRLRALYQQMRAVSLADVQAAEATSAADRAAAQAAQAAIAASRQAVTLQWGATLSQAVLGNSPLFQALANGREMLLQVTLPSDGSIMQPPSTLDLQGAAGTVQARYLSAAAQTDARLQGASYFYVAPAGSLRLGESIAVALPTGDVASGLHVPAQAIVRWQGRQWVYATHDAVHFVRRELPEGGAEADGWAVPADFAKGGQVVVQGAQTLLSEELRSQQKGDTE